MASREKFLNASCTELCDLLAELEETAANDSYADVISTIQAQNLDGRGLLELTGEELKEVFPIMGLRKRVQRFIDANSQPVSA